MYRLRPIRKKPQVRLAARTLRGVEGAFWFVLALAVALGGQGALSGLPKLGDLFSPSGMLAAQARSEKKADFAVLSIEGLRQGDFAPAVLYPVVTHVFPEWMRRPSDSAPSAAPAIVQTRLPAIAIVIDDMGGEFTNNRRAIALPSAVALSFLPYPEATPELAGEGARAGHDIMVHVPMQAEADADPGPMALRIDQTPEEMVRRLNWDLARVPGFIGINNHMGSRFTENRAAMVPVVEALLDRHIFFFDSLTSPKSEAATVARAFGVASAARDVFLDDVQTPAEVEQQLAELEKIARSQGVALAIGHPHGVTLDVLARWCANLKGFRLVRIKDAIRMKTEREMGIPVASLSPIQPSP